MFLGYVYYEVDCFDENKNPYVPIDAPTPSFATDYQKYLTGEGVQERKDICKRVEQIWDQKIQKKLPMTEEEQGWMDEYIDILAENIMKERKRIGGDWAVTFQIE